MLGSIPQIVQSAMPLDQDTNTIRVERNDIILFQGDSITDNGRNKESRVANDIGALGRGYAMLASAYLLRQLPQLNLQFINQGISGNKVHQLAERWETDCLEIKPNVLSILIGVNDYWHTKTGGYTGTLQTYIDDYRKLLDDTLERLPKIKLIIGEPFAVNGIRAVTDDWYPILTDTAKQPKTSLLNTRRHSYPTKPFSTKPQTKPTGHIGPTTAYTPPWQARN